MSYFHYEPVPKALKEFTEGYIEALIWLSLTPIGEESEELETLEELEYTFDNLSKEMRKEILEECQEFMDANWDDLEKLLEDWPQHGHDFYLTREGHGAGFWDRGYGDVGERLTEASEVYGSVHTYIEDSKIYLN